MKRKILDRILKILGILTSNITTSKEEGGTGEEEVEKGSEDQEEIEVTIMEGEVIMVVEEVEGITEGVDRIVEGEDSIKDGEEEITKVGMDRIQTSGIQETLPMEVMATKMEVTSTPPW